MRGIAATPRTAVQRRGVSPTCADDIRGTLSLADADRAIGPTYLMRTGLDDPHELAAVWEAQILPLLEDQLYGSGIDVSAHYGLDALTAALSAISSTA